MSGFNASPRYRSVRSRVTVDVQTDTRQMWWANQELEVHAMFATESLEEAKKLLLKAKFDARGAVKCLELAMRELRSAKDCLVGKALWPNLW
jgi:hypothetical protein